MAKAKKAEAAGADGILLFLPFFHL